MEQKNSKAFPTLTSERLTLRQLAVNDAQQLFLLRSDASINKYLNRQPSKTVQDALAFIETIKNNSLSYWAIAQKENDKLIGTICLYAISEEVEKGEIGYELLTAYQGTGFMKEAANKVIDYATQTLQLKTIEAFTHKDNESSTKLLNELNFKNTHDVEEGNSNLMLFRWNSKDVKGK